jgi:type IV secretory pathway VirD2 relaxase
MGHDEEHFSIKPRISGTARKEKSPSLRSLKLPKSGNQKNWRSAAAVKPAHRFSRRVIIKARVVKMNAYGLKAASMHINYIERGGVEKDGSQGTLYGKNESFYRQEFMRPMEQELNQFRFIVSPEDAHEIELTDFTKELMKQMEKDLGRKLEWGAVNHYNTDNPHVHIVVRGIDGDGEPLTIHPKYIGEGMRYRAQDIVTKNLGWKSEHEIRLQEEQEIGKGRLTRIDRKIAALENEKIVDVGSYPYDKIGRLSQARMMGRLEKLEEFGLAEKVKPRCWRLDDQWQEKLKQLGTREEIYRTMHTAVGGNTQRYRINAVEGEIQGKVVRKGLENEIYDRYFVIVEEASGTAHYLTMNSTRDAQDIAQGDLISIKKEKETWLKKSDKIIAEHASNNGWIYDPKEHLKTIREDRVKLKDGRTVPSTDFVAALERRLLRLKSYRLAEMLPGGAWRVEPGMVATLAKQDTEGAIERLKIGRVSSMPLHEQITYRGRTWIDRFTSSQNSSSIATHGFGAELRENIRRRILFLDQLGIDPGDPARGKRLDGVERNDLAERLSMGNGAQVKSLMEGERIKGVLSAAEGALPSGKLYAQVLDSTRKEFALVPWQKEFEQLAGKQVELAHVSGRFRVRGIDRSIGR